MAVGGGKYQEAAEQLLRKHGGELCIVVLVGKDGAPYFDVAARSAHALRHVPMLLRQIAQDAQKDIDAAIAQGPQ